MTIRSLFDKSRPIDRQITSVINYSGDTEDQLEIEIQEYEVTANLERHYERLMINLSEGFKSRGGHEIGVWISGFYGSGKSSFTKYLGFALDPNRKIKGQPFLKRLQNQFPTNALRQQLQTLATQFPATVIMLDLAAVASAQAAASGVSRLLYWKVMEWAGYSKEEKVALFELKLEADGKFAAFKERIEKEALGKTWGEIKNDPLVCKTLVSRLAPEFYPQLWQNAKAFNEIKIELMYGEDERVKQMLDLIERRTGNRRVVFIIDEVGQFIEGMDRLILNVQGLAENFKNVGRGNAWIIATAQQTLPLQGPLFKLKDRFPEPMRVDIESSDIREITYRRLLRKSPEGERELKKRFKEHEGGLTNATQLKNTRYHVANFDEEMFARFYPFLPQHFGIVMELLRTLARSTGGIGLRSAIKVIQDVLVDVGGQRAGSRKLADAEVGALATADIFYDTLRTDIERANRQLAETVAKVVESRGKDSLAAQVVKAIAVLQLVEGFPVSRWNVAAVLYPALGATPLDEEVNKAINGLLNDKSVPLTEIDGSLRFMSEAVSLLMGERQLLQPSSADVNRILAEELRTILQPVPSALVENSLAVKAQVKQLQGELAVSVVGDKSEVELHTELSPALDFKTTLAKRENDSRQTNNRQIIYLVGEDSYAIGDLVREIYRCEEINKRHRSEAAEKDVLDFVRAQGQRADTLKRDLDTALQNAFLKGSFVFRGQPRAVSTLGTELLVASKSQLQSVAAEVFNRFKEAPIPADSSLAEKLLATRDLANIAAPLNPLNVIRKQGKLTNIDTQHPALVSIVDYLRNRGEVDGKKLLEDFQRAPFGWFKDTTRYLAAALLIAGSVRVRVGAQWIKVAGDKAIEAFKSNLSFGKCDLALNDTALDHKLLIEAAQRLQKVTGENVLPMPQNISRAVQDHFPSFQKEYASLASELTRFGLPGSERAERLLKQLTQVLQGDASDAPAVLGAPECDLIQNLSWAREVRKALEQKFGAEALRARGYLDEIPKLPKVGAAEKLITSSDSLRTELDELLDREDFFAVATDLRNRLTALEILIESAAEALTAEVSAYVQNSRDAILGSEHWAKLSADNRATLSAQMDGLIPGKATDLESMRALLNRRIEIDSALGSIRARIEELIKTAPPAPTPSPDTDPRPPRRVRVRRCLEPVDLPPVIKDLQEAQQQGLGVELDLE